MTSSPTVRKRRLGAELRRLREDAGLSAEEVAKFLECSKPKVYRIETGRVTVRPAELKAMLKLYEASAEDQERLVTLARESRQKGWWSSYTHLLRGEYVDLESAASSQRSYESQLIPVLIQTEDYARTIISSLHRGANREEVSRRVMLRLRRQERLSENGFGVHLIIDEAAIWRRIGSNAVMHEQLNRIIESVEKSHISVQILPYAAGAHPGLDGSFHILEFEDAADQNIVYLETATSDLYIEDFDGVNHYRTIFADLQKAALTSEQAIMFLKAAKQQLT